MSDYFNSALNRISNGSTARDSDVNNLRDEVGAGFDLLPDVDPIKTGTINYATGSHSSDAYVLALSSPVTAFADGLEVAFKAQADNTGNVTINLDSLGVRALNQHDGTALPAGYLKNGKIYAARYNGSTATFELQGVVDGRLDAMIGYAEEWATKAEDSLISTAAGGDGATDYSALHHAAKAAASASAASGSASAASASASAASDSETAAAASESAAGDSETAAAASASAASDSETAAAASASAASDSETAAAASETAVQALLDGLGNINRPLVDLPLRNNLTDGRFEGSLTFTRSAGPYSYVNRYGFLRFGSDANAPRFEKPGLLIEAASANLLSDCVRNDEDGTSWTRARAETVKHAGTSPTGSRDASKLVDNSGASGTHYAESNSVSVTSGTKYTASVFVKAAEYDTVRLLLPTAGGFPTNCFAQFDLSVGELDTVGQGSGALASGIEAVGHDGWYRIWVTGECGANGTSSVILYLHNGSSVTYTGSIGSGVYTYGFQFEAKGYLSSFIQSAETFSGRASTGTYWDSAGVLQTASSGVERTTYTPGDLSAPAFQLLEPAATNNFTYSEQADNAAWVKVATTITANSVDAPDGNTTADTITSNGVSGNHRIYQTVTIGSTQGPITYSAFVKAGTCDDVRLLVADTGANNSYALVDVNLATGEAYAAQDTVGTLVDSGVEDVGNGWYRIWVSTYGASADTTWYGSFYLLDGNHNSQVNHSTSETVHVWGQQLEEGYHPSSYIVTTTAAATRVADSWSSAAGTRNAEFLTLGFDENHPTIQSGNGYSYVADVNIGDGTYTGQRSIVIGGQSDGDADLYSIFRYNSGAEATLAFYRSSGATTYAASKGSHRVGAVVGDAQSVGIFEDGVRVNYNAGPVNLITDKDGRIPALIGIGCNVPGAAAAQLHGHIANVRIYDRALNDDEMRMA